MKVFLSGLRATLMALMFALAIAPAGADPRFPESPAFRILTVKDGLPSTSVTQIAEDRQGYLWIGTTDGLARYDGVEFRVWRFDPQREDSLLGNTVTVLHIDQNDRVWVGTPQGLSIMGPERNGFRRYSSVTHKQITNDTVWDIATATDGTWIATPGGGAYRVNAEGIVSSFRQGSEGTADSREDVVLDLAVDSRDRVWLVTLAGLKRLDEARRFGPVQAPSNVGSDFGAFSVTNIDGAIWLGARHSVYRVESDDVWHQPSWSREVSTTGAALGVTAEGGGYWVPTQQGLWRISEKGEAYQIPEAGAAKWLYNAVAHSSGGVWIALIGHGLGYLPADWKQTAAIRPGAAVRDLGQVTSVTRFEDHFLLENGTSAFSLQRDGKLAIHIRDFGIPQKNAPIRNMAQDAKGQLWLAGKRAAFIKRTLAKTELLDPPNSDVVAGAFELLPAHGGMYVIANFARLERRDYSGRLMAWVPLAADEDVEHFGVSPDNVLWVASSKGLRWWDEARGTLRAIFGVPSGRQSLDVIRSFVFEGRDAFWAHRFGRMERYERIGGKAWRHVRTVGSREGFPAIAAVSMVRDGRGRIWLGSERGLYRWNPRDGRIRRYGLADGLSSQEFIRRGLALQDDGTLAAVSADGRVILVDTSAQDPIIGLPRLILDRFEVRRGANWITLSPRSLESSDAELRIRWRLLSFHDAANDRYFTRLDGHDAQWVAHSPDESGQRVFTRLAPGRYTLRVRAQDSQGRMVPEQSVSFEVMPAWWQTGWAWLLYATALLLLAAAMVWLYRRQLLRRAAWQQAQREHQFAQEASLAKTRFLATLGHEVRTPITGVLGMSELLLDTGLDPTQRSYTQAIHGAGKHLVRLVNDALDLSRIESGKLDLLAEPFDLHRLLDDVAQLAGPLARKKALAFDYSLTPTVPRGVCGDASRVRQILLNLLGNAIKFTQAGRVWLHVDAASASEVWLEVGDTGPGLNAEQQSRLFRRFEQAEGARTAASYGGSGLGLAICQELASLMGGSIAVESEPGLGARFRVRLPLSPVELPTEQETIAAHSPARRVLLVEDDDTVAQVIAGLLRAQGHAVSVVPHSLAALSELAVEQFEVALVDLDLPGMDGLTLVRHMRSQGITFPIVAVTARADQGAVDSAYAAGCDRFLRKPLSGQMLAELMSDCIALAQTDREVVEHSAV